MTLDLVQAAVAAVAHPWDVLAIAKALGGTGAAGVVGRFGWKWSRQVYAVAIQIPGTIEKVSLIHKEVFPNGGGSMRDSLTRVEENQAVNGSLTRMLASLSGEAMALGNSQGRCIWVSEHYTAITGLTNEAASGSGWVNAIHPEDRSRVLQETAAAWSEGRDYIAEFRFVHIDTHDVTPVFCRSEIVRSVRGDIRGAVATLRVDTRMGFADRRRA